ncbi:hypothetical protein [Flavobacterium lipolyticum]|uniref:Uncharacterized protein n=1 Tax=Flavobacterium lipolyticum TaxID=2893754 RepID=A0ABS8LWM7_9FLAO|nr:hypothetical protein [Flavobacterium sp. F-126]MCC9016944.1 hypothetical protein [Flavobacterium sp. F-126]
MNDDIAEEIFEIIQRTGYCEPITDWEQIKCAVVLKNQGYLNTPRVNTEIYESTVLGQEVLQIGSWKKYIKAKNKKQKNLERKEYYDSLMSRLKFYTFWPVLILGAIGGVNSIIDVEKKYRENTSTLPGSEEEQSKHNTSYKGQNKLIYSPAKVVDTLYVQKKIKSKHN